MVNLRIISSFSNLLNNSIVSQSTWKQGIPSLTQIQKRWGNFKASPEYDATQKYTDYDVSSDPKEWLYVERYLKSKTVPTAPTSGVFPSGWKPQDGNVRKELPYFVNRTRNHMQPVYLTRKNRGLRRLTVIRKIQGDIVAFESDLKKYLEKVTNREIGTQILEPNGVVKLRGDFVSRVKEWFDMKKL